MKSQSVLFLVLVAAYLAGSINFAILISRLTKSEDPRKKHSGNPGVVNIYRVMGPFYAAVVLLLDVGRAALIGLSALHWLNLHMAPAAGLALIIGNQFPIFHRFNGGKGVAAYLGFNAVTAPISAAISAAVWVLVFGVVRIPYIASFFMVAVLASGSAYHGNLNAAAIGGAGTSFALIVWAHRGNIVRHRAKRMKIHESEKSREA